MLKNPLVRLILIAGGIALLSACRRDPYAQGVRALEKGDPVRAQLLLEKSSELDPQDPSAAANLGLAYLKQGRTNEAQAAFRKAADLAPDDARPWEFMASMAMEQGQWRAAAGFLTESLRRAPQSPRVHTALAVTELYLLTPLAARTRLEAVLRMAPNYSPAVFNLAMINQYWLKNTSEAKTLFERYLKISRDPERVAQARSAIAAAEKGASPPTPPRVAPPPSVPAPPTAPVPPAVPVQKPVTRRPQVAAEAYNRGVRSHTAGDLDLAMQEYSRAVQNDPTMASAHYNLGLVFRARQELVKARSALQQALAISPDMVDARYMLALVLRDLHDPNACIIELNTLLEKNPKYAPAHHALGQLYKNDPAKIPLAKQGFNRYLELVPEGPSAQEARTWLKYNP